MTSRFLTRRRALAAVLSGAVVAALVALPATSAQAAPSTTLVINEVYGGGGNTGAPFSNDFIELRNIGATDIDLSTWSVQYASSGGVTWTNKTNLTGTLPAGGHYLIQEAAGTTVTDKPLPAPVDATGTIAMSGTNGKVALVSNQTALACGADCDGKPGVVDFVGYGSANDSETAPTGVLSNTTSASRNDLGADTDNNSADFAVGDPTPRCGTCSGTPAPPRRTSRWH